jgi:ubiquinone/menaquinone biosynthesis C-methylase UbiE
MDELDRIRQEYMRRSHDPRNAERYAESNLAHRLMIMERDCGIEELIGPSLANLGRKPSVLDIGCGNGHELEKLAGCGADADRLLGLDLLVDRLKAAHRQHGHLKLVVGDARSLPLPRASVDLITQFTVFTSILDRGMRRTGGLRRARWQSGGSSTVFLY